RDVLQPSGQQHRDRHAEDEGPRRGSARGASRALSSISPSAGGGPERRAWIRRVVRSALRAVLFLLALLVVLTALVAYKAETLVHAGATAEARRFGERIGRTITVGPAHVSLGAVLSVQIDDLRIEAAPGQQGVAADPLFEVSAVRVRVPAWSIVRSFGQDLRGAST